MKRRLFIFLVNALEGEKHLGVVVTYDPSFEDATVTRCRAEDMAVSHARTWMHNHLPLQIVKEMEVDQMILD